MLTRDHSPQVGTARAVEIIQQGGVIAYPTEAVWGLGCDPWNVKAVERVLAIKQRPVEKGVILIGASESQFALLLNPLSREDRAVLSKSWPGPHTWLVPDPDNWVPVWIKGQFQTVAIRVTDHPAVQALCHRFGKPVISTSANLSGESPSLNINEIEETFSNIIDAILTGETGCHKMPSEIRDLSTGQIIRAG